MENYSKDEIKSIIQKAQNDPNMAGHSAGEIVQGLINRGNKIEGLNWNQSTDGALKTFNVPINSGEVKGFFQDKSVGGFFGNLISSAGDIISGIGSAIIHPIRTAETISNIGAGAVEEGLGLLGVKDMKGVPLNQKSTQEKENFHNVVKYFQNRYGGKNIDEIASNVGNTVYNDPLGFMIDLSVIAGGVEGIAGKIGKLSKVAEAAGNVSKYTDVIKAGSKISTKLVKGGGIIGKSILGLTTRRGTESIAEAFNAGVEGGKANKAFLDALRGKTSGESIIGKSQSALGNIIKDRSNEYIDQMNKLKINNPKALDISPILNKSEQLKNEFGIKTDAKTGELDFSRSPLINDQNKVKAALNIIQDWGSQAGDRTVVGIDLLKRQLREFREINNPQLNKFIDSLASEAKSILTKNVKGYSELEGNYASKTELIKEIQRNLSLGQKKSVEDGLRKMEIAIKTDNVFKTELMKELQKNGADNLMEKIAGLNLGKALPDDIFRGAFDFYTIFRIVAGESSGGLFEVAATMPRVVGEFVNKLGYGARPVNAVIKLLQKYDELRKAGKIGSVSAYYIQQTNFQDQNNTIPKDQTDTVNSLKQNQIEDNQLLIK